MRGVNAQLLLDGYNSRENVSFSQMPIANSKRLKMWRRWYIGNIEWINPYAEWRTEKKGGLTVHEMVSEDEGELGRLDEAAVFKKLEYQDSFKFNEI